MQAEVIATLYNAHWDNGGVPWTGADLIGKGDRQERQRERQAEQIRDKVATMRGKMQHAKPFQSVEEMPEWLRNHPGLAATLDAEGKPSYNVGKRQKRAAPIQEPVQPSTDAATFNKGRPIKRWHRKFGLSPVGQPKPTLGAGSEGGREVLGGVEEGEKL